MALAFLLQFLRSVRKQYAQSESTDVELEVESQSVTGVSGDRSFSFFFDIGSKRTSFQLLRMQ